MTASNIIPDSCTIQVERRLMPNENADAVKALIESVACDALAGIVSLPQEIIWTQFYPAMELSADNPWLAKLDGSIKSVIGTTQYDAVAYATNGGFYSQAGIPSVVFGPGSIADAHTENESISIQEVEEAAKVFHRFLVLGK